MANISVSVQFDPRQIDQARARVDAVGLRIAMQAAVSDTITTGRKEMAQLVGKTLNMKIGDIKEQIKTVRGSFKNLEGQISVLRKPVKLIYYKSRQTKAGVSAKPWKDRPAQLLKSTFHGKMKSGHRGVFERARLIEASSLSNEERVHFKAGVLHFRKARLVRDKISGSGRVKRLPIQERFGPSVITAITGNKGHTGVGKEIVIDLSETLSKNMESQLKRVTENPESIARLRRPAARALFGSFAGFAE